MRKSTSTTCILREQSRNAAQSLISPQGAGSIRGLLYVNDRRVAVKPNTYQPRRSDDCKRTRRQAGLMDGLDAYTGTVASLFCYER
jgi:hypothetical protein